MEQFSALNPEGNPDIEYFQELADGAPVLIWMSGRDMGCFFFNRAWLEYRGRTTEEEFGNGWAEGVHPDDLDRCVQHYVSSFEKRVPFAMSYRLQHHTGEFRWILDRGAPHFDVNGEFLGYFGGCAETSADITVERLNQLRDALQEMRTFAERVATAESGGVHYDTIEAQQRVADIQRLLLEDRVRQNAAAQISQLAADMLQYDRIPEGACIR